MPVPVFDVVPQEIVRALYQIHELRDPGVIVAEIVDAQQPKTPLVRRLAFVSTTRRISVEVRVLHGLLGLCVAVQPPAAVVVQVRHKGTPLTARCDARGRCWLAAVQPGPVSLNIPAVGIEADPVVATPWAVL